jgi:hypothetical protein
MQFLMCLVMWRYKGKHKVLQKCHYSCLVICWWNTSEPQTGLVQVEKETASNIYTVVLNTLRPWPNGWSHNELLGLKNTEKFTKNVMTMHTSTNYVFCMWPSTWKCIEELKTYHLWHIDMNSLSNHPIQYCRINPIHNISRINFKSINSNIQIYMTWVNNQNSSHYEYHSQSMKLSP